LHIDIDKYKVPADFANPPAEPRLGREAGRLSLIFFCPACLPLRSRSGEARPEQSGGQGLSAKSAGK